MEGEGNDRANITLPSIQLKLLQAINETGVPIVVVLINGGQVACPWVKQHVPAVVEAFYPGQFGGTAIAAILYGDASPSGRLPYTIYNTDFTNRRPDIGDMSLSANGGITYQYYTGKPLWPFGYGLSYTTAKLAWVSPAELCGTNSSLDKLSYVVTVTNKGSVPSDVTVLAFITHRNTTAPEPLPRRQLFAFCRVSDVQPTGPGKNCTLAMAASVVARSGVVFPGDYAVTVELGDGTSLEGGLVVAEGDR